MSLLSGSSSGTGFNLGNCDKRLLVTDRAPSIDLRRIMAKFSFSCFIVLILISEFGFTG